MTGFAVCQLVWALRCVGVVRRLDLGTSPVKLRLCKGLKAIDRPELIVDDFLPGDASPADPELEAKTATASGELSGHLLADVLRGYYVQRSTGVLSLIYGSVTSRVYLSRGSVVGASSNAVELRLGETLVRLGYLDQEDLSMSLEVCEGQPLGQFLIVQDLITREQLNRAVETQIQAVLKPVFDWPKGRYLFEEGLPDLSRLPLADLSVANLILEGVRGMNDFEGILAFLGSLGGALAPHSNPLLRFQKLRLQSTEGYLLSLMDGRTGYQDILAVSPLSDEESARIVYGLILSGVVEVVAPGQVVEQASTAVGALPPASALELAEAELRFMDADHYEVLGVEREAADGMLAKAFADEARRLHPDRGLTPAHKDSLEALFARVIAAWGVLGDPNRRGAYDAELARAAAPEPEPAEPASDEPTIAAPSRPLLTSEEQAAEVYKHGAVSLRDGDIFRAVSSFRQAVKLVPDNIGYQLELAKALAVNPKWRGEAQRAFDCAFELAPWNVKTMLAMGKFYLRYKDERAKAMFKLALEANPTNAEAEALLKGKGSTEESKFSALSRMLSHPGGKGKDKGAAKAKPTAMDEDEVLA